VIKLLNESESLSSIEILFVKVQRHRAIFYQKFEATATIRRICDQGVLVMISLKAISGKC
jgi:hypothetical protein